MTDINKKNSFYRQYLRPMLRHKVFTLFLILIALIIFFTVWANLLGRNFLALSTFRNILNLLVLPAFLSIGAGFLLIGGHIDLSAWSIGAFGGMVVATAIVRWHLPWYAAFILCLMFCAVFGAINATLVTHFRFPAFISTLAMSSMSSGLMYLFSSIGSETGLAANVPIIPANPVLDFLGQSFIWELPVGVVVMLIFFLAYGVFLLKTKTGRKITLMGGNRVSAHLAGINARRLTYFLFINSAVLAGVSGIFSTARLAQGQLLALQTSQFSGITAAVLGGISFGGGAGGMGGAFVGLLILQTFQIGMGVVSVNPFWVTVFTGFMLILALAIDHFTQLRVKKSV